MKLVHGFLWLILSINTLDDFSKSVKFNNDSFSQVPEFIIEQRKNIVGLWVNEYDSKDRIEFKSNGTGVIRYASEPVENFNYQIVNTTPQCGYQLTQKQLKSSSFLQTYEPEDATDILPIIGLVNSRIIRLFDILPIIGLVNSRIIRLLRN
jgi:hypothetical protein